MGGLKFKPSEVAKLLGTANDKEQVQRIQALRQPVFSIVIQFDPRTGNILWDVVGGLIQYAALRHVLQQTIELTVQEEAAKRAAAATAPAGAPPVPAPAPVEPAPPAPPKAEG
jgi:hypothetical protein